MQSPEEIVESFRKRYVNKRSCSVMLSRYKQQLKREGTCTAEFLKQLCLTQKEYTLIRELNQTRRQEDANNCQRFNNGDAIIQRALRLVRSENPKDCFCGLVVVSGLRPIELVKTATFAPTLRTQHMPAYWICQTAWAKRRDKFVEPRDRAFLCPFTVVKRAIDIVRKRWPCEALNNIQVNHQFSNCWLIAMRQRFKDLLPYITPRIMRRFFSTVIYHSFPKLDGKLLSALASASHQLGHTVLADQVIAYSSIVVQPAPKINIFEENTLLDSIHKAACSMASKVSSCTASGSSSSDSRSSESDEEVSSGS